jgi:pilus assembly protein CpaB
MRATSIRTNEVMNVAGFLFPGSHVDVLVTMRAENGVGNVTRTVLQNVQVLATGTKMDPDPNGKPENVSVVTLLVDPPQSEKLALAQTQGTIHFVLRNGGDSAIPNTAPVDTAELSGVPKKVAKAHTKTIIPKIPEPTTFTVETLVGGKVLVSKFQQTNSEPAQVNNGR